MWSGDTVRRAADGLCAMLEAERPAFLPEETLCFTRTVKQLPDLYTTEEMETLRKSATGALLGMDGGGSESAGVYDWMAR